MSNPIVSDSEAIRAAIKAQKLGDVRRLCWRENSNIAWREEGDELRMLAKSYHLNQAIGFRALTATQIYTVVRCQQLYMLIVKDMPKVKMICDILNETTYHDLHIWSHPTHCESLREALSRVTLDSATQEDSHQRDEEYVEITRMLYNRARHTEIAYGNGSMGILPPTEVLSADRPTPPRISLDLPPAAPTPMADQIADTASTTQRAGSGGLLPEIDANSSVSADF